MFEKTRWYSERMQREATLVRWGNFGQPILVFPTAGGDAEEIERFHLVRVLDPLIQAGRIKVYSCDSVAGRAMLTQEGSPQHRMWLINQFHQYVRHEVVPAIRRDCRSDEIPIWTTGASIGAFHSVAVTCRWPHIFHRALGMSGTWNLLRFLGSEGHYTDDYFVSSPLQFVPTLDGMHLDELRKRFILIASGAGRAENMGESWAIANTLGAKGIPNRVDPWGPEWHHDWVTWRKMLPQYLEEWTKDA
ncbi:MAG: esterase family protein [Myxococcota bacterium]